MNAHHAGTTEEVTIATNKSQSMTLLIDTLASDITYAPARRRYAPAVGPTVRAVAVAIAGLLLGALVGMLIGLVVSILLAGPNATLLLVLGGAGEGALAGVVIGSWAAIRAS
jgi:purine-cytosine permease-like protein